MLDCFVTGGGPAGLLAAVYPGRYHRTVQVIDVGESIAWALLVRKQEDAAA
jgi:thioredoxin reductase (NADPH)